MRAKWFTRSAFTLIELMVVMSIIAILLGIGGYGAAMAKSKAKFVRWQVHNEMFNRDPDTVINYNFMDMGFRLQDGKTATPALHNGASGCTVPGFEPPDYHGRIRNAQWVRGGGRSRHHHAIQFDGRRSYIEIPGHKALDIDPDADDLTILMWVRFDSISGARVLFAKAEWMKVAQYDMYLYRNTVDVDVGSMVKGWRSPVINAGKWHHLALVVENHGGSEVVLNPAGKPVPGKSKDTRIVQAYLNGEPMGKESAAGMSAPEARTERPFLLGGVWVTGSSLPRHLLQGRMDEFILVRRALKPGEIANHCQTGKY